MTLVNVLVFFQKSEHCCGLLQLLLQLQNCRLPTFCLLQIVQRHPLTIEALHTVPRSTEAPAAALASRKVAPCFPVRRLAQSSAGKLPAGFRPESSFRTSLIAK
jgi:hypothetical protein